MNRRSIISIVAIFANIQYEAIARPSLTIVNGTTAEDGEFPYMVQLRDYVEYYACGGAILGPEWILTAGHCVEDGQINSILYGTNVLNGYPNTTIRVKNWFLHPNFMYTSAGVPIYDVGILQLEKPIPLGISAQEIRLAESNASVPFHVQGILAGWGFNETWGQSPQLLQKINRTLLQDDECTNKINNYSETDSFLSTHHLCSDDFYDGKCFGDAGSPIVINGIQYGITSWSYKPCGIVPAVYSRITNPEYRDWIKLVTNI